MIHSETITDAQKDQLRCAQTKPERRCNMYLWLSLLKVLIGFILAMLGLILAIHSEYTIPGLLVSFAGAMAVLTGLPNHNERI